MTTTTCDVGAFLQRHRGDGAVLDARVVSLDAFARRRVLGEGRSRFGAWVAEPARPGLAPPPFEPLHTYAVCTYPDVDSPTRAASIYRIDPAGVASSRRPSPQT